MSTRRPNSRLLNRRVAQALIAPYGDPPEPLEPADDNLADRRLLLLAQGDLDGLGISALRTRERRRVEAVTPGIERFDQVRRQEQHRWPEALLALEAKDLVATRSLGQGVPISRHGQIFEMMRSRHLQVCSLFVLERKLWSR